jgi:hypothetical protein
MKNDYEVRGDVTAIFLKRKNGEDLETLIDTSDLSRVTEFTNTWRASWSKGVKGFYVYGHVYKNGKQTSIPLHRWVLKTKKGFVVDHKNHDTLDNRRENIWNASYYENSKNRVLSPFEDRGKGYCWHNSRKKWMAYICKENKTHYLGYFAEEESATEAASEAREATRV